MKNHLPEWQHSIKIAGNTADASPVFTKDISAVNRDVGLMNAECPGANISGLLCRNQLCKMKCKR